MEDTHVSCYHLLVKYVVNMQFEVINIEKR